MIDVSKNIYSIDDFRQIVRLLRGENGCEWDKVQTHESLRKYLIEETYEVCEAIDCKDPEMLREELGDILLHVLLHSQIADETGEFKLDDVVTDICKKLIVRHPHVFGDVKVSGTEDILNNWHAIKQETKGQTNASETLCAVPKQLPALMRSQKVQQRAQRAGIEFGYKLNEDACNNLYSEINKLQKAINESDTDSVAEHLGDVIFASVNVARHQRLDAEELLTASCNKFISKFCVAEKLASLKDEDH